MPKIIENAENKIIDEGRKILLKHGYKALNIRDIAKQCNIGTGTFYNYFASKDELAIAIFNDDWNKSLSLIENLKHNDMPFKEKLNTIYKSLEGFIDKYMSIFYEMVNNSKSYRHNDVTNYEILYQQLGCIIEKQQKAGNITTELEPVKLAEFIISNLFYICRTHFITFEQFYSMLNLC